MVRDVGDRPAKARVKKLKGESAGVQLSICGEKMSVLCGSYMLKIMGIAQLATTEL